MANFFPVGKTSEFQDGTTREVLVQGRKMLLARIRNKYYATDNRCPHMGGNYVRRIG
ncbi:MAG: Rieske (2Fe-2S) protein [Dehalococcoidales bacterium]